MYIIILYIIHCILLLGNCGGLSNGGLARIHCMHIWLMLDANSSFICQQKLCVREVYTKRASYHQNTALYILHM